MTITVGEWSTPSDATQQVYVRAGGGTAPSTEEGAGPQGFTPSRAYLSLQEVYGYLPHQNCGTHLVGVVPDNAIWKMCWRWLVVQSSSWYSNPPG